MTQMNTNDVIPDVMKLENCKLKPLMLTAEHQLLNTTSIGTFQVMQKLYDDLKAEIRRRDSV